MAIAGSLVAAFVLWAYGRLFGRRDKENLQPPIQQIASPVMTQTFQPTITIHPPEPSTVSAALQIKVSFGFLVYGTSLGEDQMLFFQCWQRQCAALAIAEHPFGPGGRSENVSLHMHGESRMTCFIESGLSLSSWQKLAEVKSTLR